MSRVRGRSWTRVGRGKCLGMGTGVVGWNNVLGGLAPWESLASSILYIACRAFVPTCMCKDVPYDVVLLLLFTYDKKSSYSACRCW